MIFHEIQSLFILFTPASFKLFTIRVSSELSPVSVFKFRISFDHPHSTFWVDLVWSNFLDYSYPAYIGHGGLFTILMWDFNWHYTHTDYFNINLTVYWCTCHFFFSSYISWSAFIILCALAAICLYFWNITTEYCWMTKSAYSAS